MPMSFMTLRPRQKHPRIVRNHLKVGAPSLLESSIGFLQRSILQPFSTMGLKPSKHEEMIQKYKKLEAEVDALPDVSQLSGAAFLALASGEPWNTPLVKCPETLSRHSRRRVNNVSDRGDPEARLEDRHPGPVRSLPPYGDPAPASDPESCRSDEAIEVAQAPTVPAPDPAIHVSRAPTSWRGFFNSAAVLTRIFIFVLICFFAVLLFESGPGRIRPQSVVLESDDWMDMRQEMIQRSQEIKHAAVPIAEDLATSFPRAIQQVSQNHHRLESLGSYLGTNLTCAFKLAVKSGSTASFAPILPLLHESYDRTNQVVGSLDESTSTLRNISSLIGGIQSNLTRDNRAYERAYSVVQVGWDFLRGTRQTNETKGDSIGMDRAHAVRQEFAPILARGGEAAQRGQKNITDLRTRLTQLVVDLAYISDTIELQQKEDPRGLSQHVDHVILELNQAYSNAIIRAIASPRAKERFETYFEEL